MRKIAPGEGMLAGRALAIPLWTEVRSGSMRRRQPPAATVGRAMNRRARRTMKGAKARRPPVVRGQAPVVLREADVHQFGHPDVHPYRFGAGDREVVVLL